ncbi:hypothetical protein RO3G_11328 [Rhizopus delemar RA 99-880]|uniref:Uncharacterized protein n=1 Tax=Rhizopus delemar (strain RA 99-880 / ATCC MYA-4621 / FGSC 9543 / NRRL 43880) TaxID=246409 RepID=I1CDT7_RHIO9|nr:hypothetical protein RO3G_11328 [Rhizopus delemar RA 99-880]|eukprot:EIE86617.1 hypothetical protein RO3G_11328 [Rhizopus delemar RA 99-880]
MLLNRSCPTLDPDRGTQQLSAEARQKDQEGDQQQTARGPWLNVIPSDTMRCYDPKKGLTSTAAPRGPWFTEKKWMIQHDQVEFEDNDGHGAE